MIPRGVLTNYMNRLVELLKSGFDKEHWPQKSSDAFDELFGSENGRYPSNAKKSIQFRCPGTLEIPFSAIIHEANPNSGGYGGMSFVIFPVEACPPLIAMGTGTQGLSPDEHILGKAGHSRKMNAICNWLNRDYGNGKLVAWAKKDAVRIDVTIPDSIRKQTTFEPYQNVFARYGAELYGFCIGESEIIEIALKAFLDFNFEERGYLPLKKFTNEFEENRVSYFQFLLPTIKDSDIANLLEKRKYVVLQGPPGTGKTRAANSILSDTYNNRGFPIQFHPNTTYENFIGGLFPESTNANLGLSFKVRGGDLLKAVSLASKNQKQPYLLIIDEINRADLAKVLGEAIYCLEPFERRTISLNYEFAELSGNQLTLPPNLHILGTMNTADRSIAILDVAIRRRFAFVSLWPRMDVVEQLGDETSRNAFKKLLSIFVEYASEESFALMPGHSYFITGNGMDSKIQLKTNLLPLLQEYLAQGYVANFADSIHGYIQEIEAYT